MAVYVRDESEKPLFLAVIKTELYIMIIAPTSFLVVL